MEKIGRNLIIEEENTSEYRCMKVIEVARAMEIPVYLLWTDIQDCNREALRLFLSTCKWVYLHTSK
jgi:hypothetical protein